MLFIKFWHHIICFIQLIIFKLLYGKQLQIGKHVTWRSNFSIMIDANGRVVIGDNCFFNNGCSIASNRNITIGEGTLFGENVKVYDHNHRFRNLVVPIKEQGFSNGNVSIGKHCWIGSNVVILKGALIGDNCVIGAGCVIDCTVTSGTIVKLNQNIVVSHINNM